MHLPSLLLLCASLGAVESAPHGDPPPPRVDLLPSPRFPRSLSPQAAAIYRSVFQTAVSHEEDSPTPPHLIAASASYDHDIFDYGDKHKFGEQFRSLILKAEQEILIASLMYVMDSPIAKSITAALKALNDKAQAQKRRVRVYIAIDSVGNTLFAGQMPSLNAIGTLAWSRMVLDPKSYGLPSKEDAPALDIRMKAVHKGITGSIHLKIMIIDGYIAHVGSKNIDMDGGEEHTAILEGNVAESLRGDFQSLWGKDDPLPALNPALPLRISQKAKAHQVPVIVAGRKFDYSFYNSREHNPFAAAVHAAMQAAKHDIYYQALDICSKPFVEEVIAAVRRGVKVTIVTSFYVSDFMLNMMPNCIGSNRNTAKYLYDHLKDVKDAHTRLNVCWWIGHRNKAKVPKPQVRDYTHVKALAIDKQLVMIGSANNDPISWYSQWEYNLIFDDRRITQRILAGLARNQRSLKFCYHDDGSKWKSIE